MWMTITSLAVMLSFSDFGMGNGLINSISEASGRDDRAAAARSVASAFYMLLGIAAVVLVFLVLSFPWMPWWRLLNLTSPLARAEAGPAAAVFITCFALCLPVGVVQRIQMGYQETFQSNLWQIAGSITGLCALLVAIHCKAGLPWLIAALSGGPVVAGAANLLVEFTFARPWLAPAWESFNWGCSKQLLGIGAAFLCMQVGISITQSSDNFIIAQYLGPREVARFSVAAKLFSLVPFMSLVLLMPLWPAYGEAYSRGDIAWIRRTLRRTALFGVLASTLFGSALVVFGPVVVRWWTRGQVTASSGLLIALCASAVVTASTYPHGVFLLGINAVRFSAVAMLLVAVFSVAAKIVLVPVWGLSGVAWGTAIPFFCLNTIPIILYAPRLLARAEARTAGQRVVATGTDAMAAVVGGVAAPLSN